MMKNIYWFSIILAAFFIPIFHVQGIASFKEHEQEIINAYKALPKDRQESEFEKAKVREMCLQGYPLNTGLDPTTRVYNRSQLKICLAVIGEKPPNPFLGMRSVFTGHRFSM